MADSIREQILQAAEAALDGVGKPSGLTVHRERRRPLDRDDLPAQVVYWTEEEIQRSDHTSVLRALRLHVEHRVLVSSGIPDAAVDPFTNWGTSALMGDAALDALIHDIEEIAITREDNDEGDAVYAGALQTFEVSYYTSVTDQTVAG